MKDGNCFFVTTPAEQRWFEAMLEVEPIGKPIDVLEVYASPQSQLCHAIRQLGGNALRFTEEDGDLATLEGQKKLFQTIAKYRPEHIWMSPECRPYCKWNRFNMKRSLSLFAKITSEQQEAEVHLDLCSAVCKYQISQQRHFHLEHPQESLIWNKKQMKEVLENTEPLQFDQCRYGLKHPQNRLSMKKRTRVQTTSQDLIEALNSQYCTGDHLHAPIAGSCRDRFGRTVQLSRHAAFYPRILARKIAKVLVQQDCRFVEVLTIEDEPPPHKKARTKPPESKEETSPIEQSDGPWKEVMEKIRDLLPKSGQRQWQGADSSIRRMIQELCPDMEVKLVVACKGVEKFMTTTQPLPIRKTLVLTRLSHKVYDLGTEKWSEKPKSHQRRKAIPSHVMVCVFGFQAGTHESENPPERPESQPEEKKNEETPNQSTLEPQEEFRAWTPLITTSHGPGYEELDEHRQGVVRKFHINLGHPAADAFARHLKEAGAAPEIVRAARDYACPTCAERSPPKLTTPGQLKEAKDFNDRVLMDGFEWKNKQGEKFYVVHILDEATHFHLGKRILRDNLSTIRFFEDSWSVWAGNPKEVVHDTAGEWISENWAQYLCDEGIVPNLSSAPWQRGRIERHGSIVKEMLSKIEQDCEISNNEEFDRVLRQAFQAKNSLANKNGFSPEQAVLGRSIRLPQSLSSSDDIQAHFSAGDESLKQFQQKMETRQKARTAFLEADNNQAIRRAFLRKSRGLVQTWQSGQLCMFWDRRKAANMLEKGRWCGPARVVMHESRAIVWISHMNKLLRCAHENLRPVSLREFNQSRYAIPQEDPQRLEQLAQRLNRELRERSGMFQFSDLTNVNPPEETERDDLPSNQPEEEPKRHVSLDSAEQVQEGTAMAPEVLQPEVPNGENPNHPVEPSETREHSPEAETVGSPEAMPSDEGVQNVFFVEGNEEHVVWDDDETLWTNKEQKHESICEFEFEMPKQQLERFMKNPSMHVAYVVSAAKKSHTEILHRDLNAEEKIKFDQAKTKEVKCWIDTSTVKRILRSKIAPERIMTSRWILTWKVDPTAENGRKAKARLVVRGYQDPELNMVNTESPTLTRDARMLLCQYISSRGWRLQNFDITTAFLRGKSDGRQLAMEPPPELRSALNMGENEVCLLEGNAYGRVDAPLLFYKEF